MCACLVLRRFLLKYEKTRRAERGRSPHKTAMRFSEGQETPAPKGRNKKLARACALYSRGHLYKNKTSAKPRLTWLDVGNYTNAMCARLVLRRFLLKYEKTRRAERGRSPHKTDMRFTKCEKNFFPFGEEKENCKFRMRGVDFCHVFCYTVLVNIFYTSFVTDG